MKEMTLTVTLCVETGGFVDGWQETSDLGGITTKGDSFAELDAMITDAVEGYFEPPPRQQKVRLHIIENPTFSGSIPVLVICTL